MCVFPKRESHLSWGPGRRPGMKIWSPRSKNWWHWLPQRSQRWVLLGWPGWIVWLGLDGRVIGMIEITGMRRVTAMTGITWISRITRVSGMTIVTRMTRVDLDGGMFGMTGMTRKTRMTGVTRMTRITRVNKMTGVNGITGMTIAC